VNAAAARDVFDGRPGPVRDIVLLNAAAALLAYEGVDGRALTEQLAPQLGRVAEAVDSGAAKAKLADWVAATRSFR
jgi:anthranilate phosphoribosyltransferase